MQERRIATRIFVACLVIRVMLAVLLLVSSSVMGQLSRDSIVYDMRGHDLAELYATGQNDWSLWVDDGWFQFIGLIYYLVGPYLFLVQLMNAFLAAFAAVLVFRTASLVTGSLGAAQVCGFLFGLFPSVVYYTSLPLKEAPALFALAAVAYGIISFIVYGRGRSWWWIVLGLLIVTALRVYLVVVLIACIVVTLLGRRQRGGVRGVVQLAISVSLVGLALYMAAAAFDLRLREYQPFRYFDIDYINHVRHDMATGDGKMFQQKEDAIFGESLVSDAVRLVKGIAFFFFSIDVTNVKNSRQMAALPEVLFFLACLPYLFAGVVRGWKVNPWLVLPLILFGSAIMLIYGSTATNMGAMYRWRLQGLPFLIILIVYGAVLRRKGLLYDLVRRSSRQLQPHTRRGQLRQAY